MEYPRINPLRLDIDRIQDISPEPALPVAAATLRQHCAAVANDDDLLEQYQRSAVSKIENLTHRTIVSRTHTWILSDFPRGTEAAIRLPRGKTQSVESIQYVSNGATTTLTGPSSSPVGDDYQEDLSGEDGGVLMPLRGTDWPSVDSDVPAPVRINFTAGYEEDEVPDDLITAIMFAVSDQFEYRGAADVENERTVNLLEAFIGPYRLSRIY